MCCVHKTSSAHIYLSVGPSILLSYFQIVELDLPYDRVKQQRRAFGFVTFENESVVEAVVATQRHLIVDGKKEVSALVPEALSQL